MLKNFMVQIEENKILELNPMKKSPMGKSFKILKSVMDSNSMIINVDMNRKNVYAIVEGEEVYIKLVKIPKVSFNKIESLIRNELLYYFKDIESILFTYSILKEADKSLEVVVFCLNSDKIDVLKKNFSSFTQVKGVYLIQFCILNFMKKIITDDNFNLVFCSRKLIYLLEVRSNILKKNKVAKKVSSCKEFKAEIDGFIEFSMDNKQTLTYFVNIEDKIWLEEYLDDRAFKDLGVYSEKDIIENFNIRNK